MSEQAWRQRAELAEQENERLNATVEDLRERLDRMTKAAERLDRSRGHVFQHLRMVTGRDMEDLVQIIEAAGGQT